MFEAAECEEEGIGNSLTFSETKNVNIIKVRLRRQYGFLLVGTA